MPKAANLTRLQKVIADAGVTSRRKAEQLIQEGRVTVNGELVTTMGLKVDGMNDIISVDGNTISLDSIHKEYIILNKPRGYMTTVSDPEGRKTVMDLVYGRTSRVYPVGRLDYHSEGLLILTNDGQLANMVMHPSFEVSKTYEVKIFGTVTEKSIKELKAGMDCEDGFLKPKSVRVLKYLNNKTWIEFKLTEGKNREIRRLCENSGLTIDKLKRVAIEGLTIADVAPGKFVTMQRHQMLKLLNLHADGTRRVDAAEYFSVKKSIKVRSKHFGEKTFSTDKKFEMYRKDKYQETMKLQKQVKIDRQNEIQEKLLNERIADKKAHVPRRSTQHTGFTGSYDAVADKTDQIITK